MSQFLLFDVAPDPVVAGGLILLLIVILIFAVVFVIGFVFLLKWLKRRKAKAIMVTQPSNPNQL